MGISLVMVSINQLFTISQVTSQGDIRKKEKQRGKDIILLSSTSLPRTWLWTIIDHSCAVLPRDDMHAAWPVSSRCCGLFKFPSYKWSHADIWMVTRLCRLLQSDHPLLRSSAWAYRPWPNQITLHTLPVAFWLISRALSWSRCATIVLTCVYPYGLTLVGLFVSFSCWMFLCPPQPQCFFQSHLNCSLLSKFWKSGP